MWTFKLLVIFCGIAIALADHWGYPVEQENGVVKGPENWGGQCALGRRQSPIDLAEDASVVGVYPSLSFINYSEPIQNAKVRHTGHSLQIDVTDGQEYLMTGGGLPGTFVMDQMHFHWASEHTLNNERYGLELHIVSHEKRFGTFAEAVQNKNGVAVLGILFHVSDAHNINLKNILDSAEPIKNAVGGASLIKAPIAPADFLPKNRNSFFRYEGSLTTPTCDEAVIWTILTESVPFAMLQIERFKETTDDVGGPLTHNYRQLQRLNSRALVYVKQSYGDSGATTMTTISVSMLVALQVIRRVIL
ncbi:putative carbonic anhydrase 3 [Bradysia coprophila]|uniref:putative carbonic anhydrase 3 n=1 Tax=Bradysia coprophila TaxID=38358 RepID=UPI00187DB0A5|nr:putative carbonic anhydrase 3 [Bradysia coprophila]